MRAVSASRRTDIPALYSRWLFGRLRAGFCHVINPYAGQVYRVQLGAEQVVALALFTRDPRPLLRRVDWLEAEGYAFYVHVTMNGYPRWLEPASPPLDAVVPAVRSLAERVGPRRVVWRYDPLLLSERTSADYHRARFSDLAARLEGAVESCFVSFATRYRKTERKLARVAAETGVGFERLREGAQVALARDLRALAAAHGITLYGCASPLLETAGLARGACVDRELLQELRPDLSLDALKATPTRAGCGCCAATDIGAFDTCTYGCAYCYATQSRRVARARRARHDPDDTVLWRPASLRRADLSQLEVPLADPLPGRGVAPTSTVPARRWPPRRGAAPPRP